MRLAEKTSRRSPVSKVFLVLIGASSGVPLKGAPEAGTGQRQHKNASLLIFLSLTYRWYLWKYKVTWGSVKWQSSECFSEAFEVLNQSKKSWWGDCCGWLQLEQQKSKWFPYWPQELSNDLVERPWAKSMKMTLSRRKRWHEVTDFCQ